MTPTHPADLTIDVNTQPPTPGHTLLTPPFRRFDDPDIDYTKSVAHAPLTIPLTITFRQQITGLYAAGDPIDLTNPATQHAIATAITTALATHHGQTPLIPGESPLN